MDEGYIKFSFELDERELPSSSDWEIIETARKTLHKDGLIGSYPNGIGFGNISIRIGPSEFLITGSATGRKSDLTIQDYCIVNECDLSKNHVRGIGKTNPSSESMSHGAIYSASSRINAVVHVHSKKLFDRILADEATPKTSLEIRYGTPEMAHAITEIVNRIKNNFGYFVTAGHDEGIFAFGETIEDASLQIDELSKKYS